MSGNVGYDDAERIIALREDYAKVAANSAGWAVVRLHSEVFPN
jgi:hypothetical protein